MTALDLDFETRSAVKLFTHGAYVYFESETTDALMASYSFDGQTVKRWRREDPCPADIREHIENGGTINAHNASFERLAIKHVLAPKYGWPEPKLEQYRCTAATAAALALPRDLDRLGKALDLAIQKDKEGKRLIQKFSVPRRKHKGDVPGAIHFNEPEDHPDDFEKFHDYCDDDVRTEAGADKKMVELPREEQELYWLDQKINDRGVRIDIKSAKAALKIAELEKANLDRQMSICTKDYVTATTQVAKLTEWVVMQGIPMDSAAKADILELLDLDDLPANVRTALELRQEGAKASVSKLKAMLNRASADGRVRGMFMYHAASTGRWSSVGVQLQNLPRPRKEFDNAIESGEIERDSLFDAFRSEDPEWLKALYGPELGKPLHLISDSIRSFIWAAPGHDLIQADFSGIEGAVAAWVADEKWKVKALHDIIADPSLPDMYRRTAAEIMNTTTDEITKKHPLRQSVGKVSELALGFGGGVAAFHSMAQNYDVDLDPLFEPVWETAPEEFREKAVKRYERCLPSGDAKSDVLSREAWIACEIIKHSWRKANPEIAGAWKLLEQAIREAIQKPGTIVKVLKVQYLVKHGFLWCMLPSGRCLAYASPRLKDQVWACQKLDSGEWAPAEVMDRDIAENLQIKGDVKIEGDTSPRATVLGVDSVTKKWRRFGLYGGLAFENIVQAIARDLLVNGMRRAEAAGYPIVMHVHDEIVAEVLRGWGCLREFEEMICVLPGWADGLPLTASGWRGKRYRKD